jgi:hypothetical protein
MSTAGRVDGRMKGLVVVVALLLPVVAQAQDDEPPGRRPIGMFAADARVALPSYGQDVETAAQLGVIAENLPGRGYGLVLGAHVYPCVWAR